MRTAVVIKSMDGQHYMEDAGYDGTAPIPRIGEHVKAFGAVTGIWTVTDVVHSWTGSSSQGHSCYQVEVWVKPGGGQP